MLSSCHGDQPNAGGGRKPRLGGQSCPCRAHAAAVLLASSQPPALRSENGCFWPFLTLSPHLHGKGITFESSLQEGELQGYPGCVPNTWSIQCGVDTQRQEKNLLLGLGTGMMEPCGLADMEGGGCLILLSLYKCMFALRAYPAHLQQGSLKSGYAMKCDSSILHLSASYLFSFPQ